MTWIWTVLLVAGLTLLTYTAVRVLRGGLADRPGVTPTGRPDPTPSAGVSSPGRSSARHILDERYASGELSTQEYEHRSAVLGGREEES